MNFTKQYIIQSIIAAANNLRLSSEKIETVAIIKERLNSSKELTEEIKNFKKITELSKLGIKLSELQNFIESGKIDFLKVSDKFKEHSYALVKEINYVLDILTPQAIRELFKKLDDATINVDLTKREASEVKLNSTAQIETEVPKRSKADELKEALIFEELNKEDGFSFENFEQKVLRPIKELDTFLNRVAKYDYTENEVNINIKRMIDNGAFSQKVGFEILSNMHKIFAAGLEMINNKKIAPSPNVIEALRACLIVIVAVVRGKEVDITNYLNRAESFGKTLTQTKKVI